MTTQQKKFEKKVQRIKGPATKPRLLGTQRMRKESRKRTAIWLHTNKWLVTGGENEHIVTAGSYINPKTFICDCGGAHDSPHGVCCHILAVMREM